MPVAAPTLNGVTVARRPVTLNGQPEVVRQDVELASGGTRSYVRGVRHVRSLSWSKLTEAQLSVLRVALSAPTVAYTDHLLTASTRMTTGDGLTWEAVPGTDPPRYSASITLRAVEVTTS